MGGNCDAVSKLNDTHRVNWLQAVTGCVLLAVIQRFCEFWSRRKMAKIERSFEQRYWNKFCVCFGKSPTETLSRIKKVYKDKAASKSQISRWHSPFPKGRENVENLESVGRPARVTIDENLTKVQSLLGTDRRSTLTSDRRPIETPSQHRPHRLCRNLLLDSNRGINIAAASL